MLHKQITTEIDFDPCVYGDKIGYQRFNMGSNLLTVLRQGKIQRGAFAGVMKECSLGAKYIN